MVKIQVDTDKKFLFEFAKYSLWIHQVIDNEGYSIGDVYYHLCSDDFLLNMNQEFLRHDYLTDILTFPLSAHPKIISGEIFISVDRVEDNALRLKKDFQQELARVLVHGVLHLMGYDDHSDAEKIQMRAKEDYYLSLLEQN